MTSIHALASLGILVSPFRRLRQLPDLTGTVSPAER